MEKNKKYLLLSYFFIFNIALARMSSMGFNIEYILFCEVLTLSKSFI